MPQLNRSDTLLEIDPAKFLVAGQDRYTSPEFSNRAGEGSCEFLEAKIRQIQIAALRLAQSGESMYPDPRTVCR